MTRSKSTLVSISMQLNYDHDNIGGSSDLIHAVSEDVVRRRYNQALGIKQLSEGWRAPIQTGIRNISSALAYMRIQMRLNPPKNVALSPRFPPKSLLNFDLIRLIFWTQFILLSQKIQYNMMRLRLLIIWASHYHPLRSRIIIINIEMIHEK